MDCHWSVYQNRTNHLREGGMHQSSNLPDVVTTHRPSLLIERIAGYHAIWLLHGRWHRHPDAVRYVGYRLLPEALLV